MSEHEDVEKILETGRVKTTPEQDARILEPARAALLKAPWRWRIVGLAAAVLLLAVVGVAALSGTAEDEKPEEGPAPEATALDQQVGQRHGFLTAGAEVHGIYTYYQGTSGDGGDGWIRLEDADSNPAPGGVELRSANNTEIVGDRILAARGEGGVGGGDGGAVLLRSLRELVITNGEVTVAPNSKLSPPANGDGGNTEAYDAITENRFESPVDAPYSTLSVDVDTASYANVRRFLTAGRLPPPGAVRIEELINYFTYDYPQPMGSTPFSVTTEVSVCPWNPKNRLVLVGLQGKSIDQSEVPPRNLVFLLDVSGSMKSANKLGLVKSAMKLLVAQLRPTDRVGIVVYAGASGMALAPTSGNERAAIVEAIDALSAGGSTNGAQGIRLAYDLARKHFDAEAINRVILATDGDFNVGTTNRDELKRLIEKERESGIFLTVLGVGTGNVKDSQMEMLADCGNGNYAYLDSLREAHKVLVREAGSTLVTIAKDVKIQIEWNPSRVGAYRLIGYENRILATRDFNDDTKDAGEIGAGHSVTALYEITPPGDDEKTGDVRPLKYQTGRSAQPSALANEILTLSLRHKAPDGDKSLLNESVLRDPGHVAYERASENLRFASAVAAFGLALRNSVFKGASNFGLVHELASTALGDDPDGDRAEFLRLAVRAGEIQGK